jgi:hypothetical protein
MKNGAYKDGIGGVSDLSGFLSRMAAKCATTRIKVGKISTRLRGETMKAKLLLSAAVIGLIAMSPAIAETVVVPVIPGSLDGADSTTGDGGNGKGRRRDREIARRTRRTPLSRPGAPAEAACRMAAMAAPRARPRRL